MVEKSIVFLRSNPVDPDSRVEKEVSVLIKAGYIIRVVAWDRNAKYKIKESFLNLEADKLKIFRFGIPATYGGGVRKNLKALVLFQVKLFIWLFKHKRSYQIIHACDFDTAYIASCCAKYFKKKLVYDIFDYYVDAFGVPKLLKKFIENQDRKIINTADAVIICSEQRKEQINGTCPKYLSVIHNTPPSINLRFQKPNAVNTKAKIAYFGILSEGRLIREIVDAVSLNSGWELHIGGFGALEEYLSMKAQTSPNITFYGKMPYNKVLYLESQCDILTAIYDPSVPNHKYAAPNKFYEALMLGKPLIMVEDTGMSNIVSQYNIGKLINYNKDDFKNAVDYLISKREEWPAMSVKMKQLYENDFRWEEMENRLLLLYKQLGN